MADIDPKRATFVRSEYRASIVSDDRINARYDGLARIVEINTNLNDVAAKALAQKIFNLNSGEVTVEEIVIEGTMELDTLIGANPMVRLTAPRFGLDGILCRITSVVTDYDQDITTLTVRG